MTLFQINLWNIGTKCEHCTWLLILLLLTNFRCTFQGCILREYIKWVGLSLSSVIKQWVILRGILGLKKKKEKEKPGPSLYVSLEW